MSLSLAILLAMTTAASDPVVLYDARLSPKPTTPSAAETALLNGTVRPVARQTFGGAEGCSEDFKVVDEATGSFTRPKAQQKAFLYLYCTTGHGFAKDGLAVIENGRVVANVFYDGGWDSALGALPDLDGDGLSELLIVSGGTNQGITTTSVTVIGMAATSVKKLGRLQVYEDHCGGGSGAGPQSASKLTARPGAHPTFFLEDFTRPSCDKGSWQKKGAARPAMPEKDEVDYRLAAPAGATRNG